MSQFNVIRIDILQKGTSKATKVGVLRIIDLRDTPRINTSADKLSVNFNLFLRANDGKGKERLCTN